MAHETAINEVIGTRNVTRFRGSQKEHQIGYICWITISFLHCQLCFKAQIITAKHQLRLVDVPANVGFDRSGTV